MRMKPKFRPNLPDAANRKRPTTAAAAAAAAAATAAAAVAATKEAAAAASVASPASPVAVAAPAAGNSSSTRVRTNSACSTSDAAVSSPERSTAAPPAPGSPTHHHHHHHQTLGSPLASPTRNPPGLMSPIRRQRRLTEQSLPGSAPAHAHSHSARDAPSVYDRRKAEHKKRFNGGTPDRNKMTMFDLIYYNPADGSRMSGPPSAAASRCSSRASSVSGRTNSLLQQQRMQDAVVPDRLQAVSDRLEEEAAQQQQRRDSDETAGAGDEDEADGGAKQEEGDDGNEMLPVPKVKVGPNGEMILDEESTVIETTAAKKAKEEILRAPLVFENSGASTTNYGSWGKKRKNVDWASRETLRFYKALSVFGTDFSMMEGVFKRRSRHELKMKFKKEERANRALVDKCLREGMQFDTSIFESESDEDDEREADDRGGKRAKRNDDGKAKKRRKKASGKRARKVVSKRGYYASSEEEDEDMNEEECEDNPEAVEGPESQDEASASGPAHRAKRTRSSSLTKTKSPLLLRSLLGASTTSEAPGSEAAVQSTAAAAAASPAAAFPPGLLAANPGLAAAVPGSLVVIAAPSPSPSAGSAAAATSSPQKGAKEKQTMHILNSDKDASTS